MIKTGKSNLITYFSKNKFLISSCAVLILGTFFSVIIYSVISDDYKNILLNFCGSNSDNFLNLLFNKLFFSLIIIILVFSAGYSKIGHLSISILLLIFSSITEIKSQLYFYGDPKTNIADYLLIFISDITVYLFFIILMSEDSFYSTEKLLKILKGKKADYKAKNRFVKLFTFTAVFVIISLITTYFELK